MTDDTHMQLYVGMYVYLGPEARGSTPSLGVAFTYELSLPRGSGPAWARGSGWHLLMYADPLNPEPWARGLAL